MILSCANFILLSIKPHLEDFDKLDNKFDACYCNKINSSIFRPVTIMDHDIWNLSSNLSIKS